MKVKVYRKESLQSKIQDTVIFMAAYDVHEFKKGFPHFWQRAKAKDLMKQHHIASMATNDTVVFQNGKLKYVTEYDPITQHTAFQFDVCDKEAKIEAFKDKIEKTNWQLYMMHSVQSLLDSELYKISFTFNLESFLVSINESIFQVDPVVFMLNGILFISYELIHFETGVPLTHDEIYGPHNNYNILPASHYKYFDQGAFEETDKKVSDIVFENIRTFLEDILQKRFSFGEFSFVHNSFVITNSGIDIDKYFMQVVGAELNNFHVQNISTTKAFSYYATEFLGICTGLNSDNLHNVMFDCLLLEAVKMYLCLNMIVDFEVTEEMEHLNDRQIYIERLCYPSHVPIITHKAIENIMQTITYKRYQSAIAYKKEALTLQRDRRRDKNSKLLNVLLYILSLFGCVEALSIFEDQYGLPFTWGLCAVLIVFGIGGLVWIYKEKK